MKELFIGLGCALAVAVQGDVSAIQYLIGIIV